MSAPADSTQDLLPARMLNEFVYCPRLYFYEHVEGIFLHNADTLKGAADHRRVDGGKGALPKAGKQGGDTENAEAAANEKGSSSSEGDSNSVEAADTTPADSAPEVIHARSVMLGSESLGVVAKLDLIEVRVDASQTDVPTEVRSVCPVEYKTGAPREGDSGNTLWDADRMQLGLQILLLRENGYTCNEGVVYYRQTRQRVRFEMTAADEDWIRRTVVLARTCASGPIPPPLDHSPKCPRCSLAPVCMPDETRFLHQMEPDSELPLAEPQLLLPGLAEGELVLDENRTAQLADSFAADGDEKIWEALPEPRMPRPAIDGEVRRLITPDIDTKVLYVNTPGVSITKKGETVVVKEKGESLAEFRIKDLHHVTVFGSAQISTALIQTLCDAEVPVSYFSMGGWFYGLTRGHGLTNVFTRIKQFAPTHWPGQPYWQHRNNL